MVNQNENFQAINKLEHKNLNVHAPKDFKHLKNTTNAIIFAEEIADVAADAPIVFLKDAQTGSFKLSTLYGLAAHENLFVNNKDNWIGTYIPVTFNINPFGIFLDSNEAERVKIDMNSPCLSTQQGHALFDGDNESLYLTNMRKQLESIIDASIQTDNFIAELVNRNLLTEFKIEIKEGDDNKQVIADLYTINVDEFSLMSQEDIIMFHEMHYWGAVYGIQQSMKQFRRLSQHRNELYPNKKSKLSIQIDRDVS